MKVFYAVFARDIENVVYTIKLKQNANLEENKKEIEMMYGIIYFRQ